MSINITVSGKVDRNCRPLHSLLEDPQVVHREQEKQRRKLRIIQVREKAKHVAKTIRNNVAKERKRCLNNYQMKKAEEIRNWRKQQFKKECNTYNTALSQIGQAHRAANEEKCKQAARKPNLQSYKQFKKAICTSAAKKNKPLTRDKCTCTEAQKCPDKESKCVCTQTQPSIETKRVCEKSKKKIQSISFCGSQKAKEDDTDVECDDDTSESECECDKESDNESENEAKCECEDIDEDVCANIIISSDSSDSESDSDSPIENRCKERSARTCKPALVLDLEVNSQDTIDIIPSYDTKNKHNERNEQFSSIIRISPKKQKQCPQEPQKQQKCPQESHKPRKQRQSPRQKCENVVQNTNTKRAQESTSSSSSSSSCSTSTNEECSSTDQIETAPAAIKTTRKAAPQCPQTKVNLEKRFSAVTNLIKKQQKKPPAVCEPASRRERSKSPKTKQSTATFTINRTPPKKCKSPSRNRSVKIPSPKKHHLPDYTLPNLLKTHHSPQKRCVPSIGSGSSKVQFYDDGNRMSKECIPTVTSFQSPRKRCATPCDNGSNKVQFYDCGNVTPKECMPPDNACPNVTTCYESPRKRCATPCDNGSPRVQFYDYHSKMGRMYAPITKEPLVECHADYSKCSAVENALREKELERQHQKYVQQKNKTTEQRGQKALEREQIRRDCNELTEKLEALNRKYPRQMLNYKNDPHIFADKGLRKEPKLTAAIEEILNRPGIITCPEVQNQQNVQTNKLSSPTKCTAKPNVLNLGTKLSAARSLAREYSSSDSCSSIILGCVDDQNKRIPPDLNCNNVVAENEETTARLKNLLKRLDSLRECLLKELKHEKKDGPKDLDKNIDDIVKCLNKVCNEHNTAIPESTKAAEQTAQSKKCSHEPVEIVITVKGDRHNVEVPGLKSNSKGPCRSTPSFGKGVQMKTLKKTTKKKYPKKKPVEPTAAAAPTLYDSNSTSYRSLPNQISTKVDGLATTSAVNEARPTRTPADESDTIPRLNPLLAQYIQRLLGMSHTAIQKLCISSSDIPTPNSTIMNTSANVGSISENPTISDERILSVQKFLEDNHCFVKELEETLRTHNSKLSVEESVEHIWRRRLLHGPSTGLKKVSAATENKSKPSTTKTTSTESPSKLKEKKKKSIVVESYSKKNTKIVSSPTKLVSHGRKDVQSPQKQAKQQTKQMIDKAIETQRSEISTGTETARKLTESCAQRIAELTELINRVRAEKQRLLEVSLSSISENGKQSTEYIELSCETESEPKISESPTKKSNLQKTQTFAASRDSGIHESRPATAQDIVMDNDDDSQPSKDKPGTATRSRKLKPASITQRLSPQLIEGEKQHDLSTIPEVDTPGTSHVIACPPQDSSSSLAISFKKSEQPEQSTQPVSFPSFEEYVQKLNLDISQLDANQKRLLEQDFCHYLDLLEQSQKQPHYNKFPSPRTYMRKCGWGENIIISEASSTTSDEKIPRISTIIPQIKLTDSQGRTLSVIECDTQHSSNSSDINDTSSIDIEAELKRRNIMQHSFHTEPPPCGNMIESGIDKSSTPSSTIEKLEQSLMRLVMQWPENCINKSQKQCEFGDTLSETTKTSSLHKNKRTPSSRIKSVHAKSGGSQALNLRDFLTKELLKHANLSASTSSITEDSLCSQFLHSIIGSMSPRPDGPTTTRQPVAKKGVDIRKTSTPISSAVASRPSTSLKFFTGGSTYSSVKHSVSDDDRDNGECGDQADKSSS